MAPSPSDPELKVIVQDGGIMLYKATEGSVGYDLSIPEDIAINPGKRLTIDTKIKIELPPGYGRLIMMQSSYAARGLVVLGGLIDTDYRGSIKVVMLMGGDSTINFARGRRFAQLVPFPVANFNLKVVLELSNTARGEGGFGSSDVKEEPESYSGDEYDIPELDPVD